jgi:hypothetical protein
MNAVYRREIKEIADHCQTDLGGRSKQNQVRPIFVDARRSLSLRSIAERQPSIHSITRRDFYFSISLARQIRSRLAAACVPEA